MRAGKFDVESNLWFMVRRLVPLHVIKDKLNGYIAEGHTAASDTYHYTQVFEEMLGIHRETNLHVPNDIAQGASTTEPEE